ncbi:prepilin-type N-terminal cleavage/methylation domain-containing protein [Azorhizophilus paspali]|uniref:Prepilin-type N-terminal cleavage/methylation domain-containing protein n=1 Tax=Azorhizophilus paspali TaxID=69963 RepID=A0ABV6SLP7_AZOPA
MCGFALTESVVALAVLAILPGMLIPLLRFSRRG